MYVSGVDATERQLASIMGLNLLGGPALWMAVRRQAAPERWAVDERLSVAADEMLASLGVLSRLFPRAAARFGAVTQQPRFQAGAARPTAQFQADMGFPQLIVGQSLVALNVYMQQMLLDAYYRFAAPRNADARRVRPRRAFVSEYRLAFRRRFFQWQGVAAAMPQLDADLLRAAPTLKEMVAYAAQVDGLPVWHLVAVELAVRLVSATTASLVALPVTKMRVYGEVDGKLPAEGVWNNVRYAATEAHLPAALAATALSAASLEAARFLLTVGAGYVRLRWSGRSQALRYHGLFALESVPALTEPADPDAAAPAVRSNTDALHHALVSSLVGSACAVLAQLVTHPLHTVAAKLQYAGSVVHPLPYADGFVAAVRRIAAEEGIAGFYRGFFSSALSFVPMACFSIVVYFVARQYYSVVQFVEEEEQRSRGDDGNSNGLV